MRRSWLVLLVASVLVGCGSAGSGQAASARVLGTVLSAPGCPVQQVASPCPPFRVAGADVVALRGGVAVVSARSAADGTFVMSVPAGTYTFTATSSGGYRSSVSQVVHVPAQGDLTITLTIDSGIR